jgi:hypothetical protein
VRFKPREHPDRWLLCPPVQFRWDLIRVFHCDLLAHSGVEQTLAAMHQHLHWPGMKADIASYKKKLSTTSELAVGRGRGRVRRAAAAPWATTRGQLHQVL